MEKLVRINLNIDEKTRYDFRLACYRKNTTMTETLKRFIKTFIKKDREKIAGV